MLEKQIEQKFVQEVKKQGGLALKFISPGLVGVPDRIVIMPGAHIGFVELKAPGGKLRPIQKAVHARLKRLGVVVLVLDRVENIQEVIDEICAA